MKLPIMTGKQKQGDMELPAQFSEPYRPDLIKRAVHSLQSKARQPYGTSPDAGMRHSSKLSKRRRKYRGCYGFGISRVNRKIHSRRGTRMHWVGTFSPQTVGGRRAHPPKAEKILTQRINKKENRKAIRSAIAATVNKDLVAQRGHHVPDAYPFILDNAIEAMTKTKDVIQLLSQLGFEQELKRSLLKKIRAGIGTLRGRKYKRRKGVLIVVNKDSAVLQVGNIPGVDIIPVTALNAEVLAPGALPGRVTLWTQAAVETVQKENLFA